MAAQFPLENTTEVDLQNLSRALWSWPLCEKCSSGNYCNDNTCPAQRSKRLVRFFDYYRTLAGSYNPDIQLSEHPALRSPDDLIRIILELKANPDLTRAELLPKLFPHSTDDGYMLSHMDQKVATNLAVRIMAMVVCSAQQQSLNILEHGQLQVPWRDDVTFTSFITNIFPTTDHPSLNNEDVAETLHIKRALMAKNLNKRARLKFRPTDNLRSHLRLDRKTGIVEIYHHTAFLKEHLRLTMGKSLSMSVSDSLKLGALPRQLVLEALDSIQKILFPLDDGKSRSLLQSLIATSNFDPDCLRFESASIRSAHEKDIFYHYFGSRLMDLYEELENPTARGYEKWFERKSGARYVMMITLIGVLIAVFLGISSLAVSLYQAWIGYQAWQHPVQFSSS